MQSGIGRLPGWLQKTQERAEAAIGCACKSSVCVAEGTELPRRCAGVRK